MRDVACHSIGGRIEYAGDIRERVFNRWYRVRWDGLSLESLGQLRDDLLEYIAVQALTDPTLSTTEARDALRTAAECGLGVLDRSVFPDGDFEIRLPLIGERLSNFPPVDGSAGAFTLAHDIYEDIRVVDLAPATARTWLDTFAICLVGGLLWERDRMVVPMLQEEYAPAIRNGVPYSPWECLSDQAEVVEMEILCLYLAESTGPGPAGVPAVPLREPTADERADAIRRLDFLDALTPDQQLLRVLLEGDRAGFEHALADRLVQYRDNAAADGSRRSLLPMGILAVTALAVQAHGWELGIRSGYLPEGLLRSSTVPD